MVNSSTENTGNSALASVIGRLGELSESELRQLYLVIGVRLGIPGVDTGQTRAGNSGKSGKAAPGPGKTRKGKAASSKGNPQRKSQWANNPLYQEYSRLKKVVENQSKEQKCSFNAVDTTESRAYRQAFNQWLEAKSSFRDRKGQKDGSEADPEESESEISEAEEAPKEPKKRVKPASPQPASGSEAPRTSPPAKGRGKVPSS